MDSITIGILDRWNIGVLDNWITGNFRYLNWRFPSHIRPCKGYGRGHTPKIWSDMVSYLQFRIVKLLLKKSGFDNEKAGDFHGLKHVTV